MLLPPVDACAEAIVNSIMTKRLAAHAVALAIHQKTHGRWPATLADLELDRTDLSPPGGRDFGYQCDPDGQACVWGFSVQQDEVHAVPPTPPTLTITPVEQDANWRHVWILSNAAK